MKTTKKKTVKKKIKLTLVGLDGNAFCLMGAFKKQARREKWKDEEITAVLDDCMSGDYNHLLNVLMDHCEDDDYDDRDDEDYGADDE